MWSEIVIVDCPLRPEEGEAGLIFMSQTDLGLTSALWRHCRGSCGWGLRHNSGDLGNQKTRKESLQDLHFGFSCVNLLLDLGPSSGPISLKVRNSGSYGFIQKAENQGEASQIPGCLDLGLGLDLMICSMIFWGYLTGLCLLWRELNVITGLMSTEKISRNVKQIISLLSYKQEMWNHAK